MTRAVEDRLSDALHEKLTQRFIDRRTSVLMKRLARRRRMDLTLDDSGGVAIGGEHGRQARGFPLRGRSARGRHSRPHAARRRDDAVSKANSLRAPGGLSKADDNDITLSEHGKLWWDGAVVANLVGGRERARTPRFDIWPTTICEAELRERIQARLDEWRASAHRRAPRTAARIAQGCGRETWHRRRPARARARLALSAV